MYFFNRFTAIVMIAALLGPALPLQAHTKKGDRFLTEGRAHEQKKEWDLALESFQMALAEDPADIGYQMAMEKTRFQASQAHVERGLAIRLQGQLGEALLEFQKAFTIHPGSTAAEQEIRRTMDMIARERRRVQETGKESAADVRSQTPTEEARRRANDKLASIQSVPELRPLNQDLRDLRLNGTPKLLFETVAALAGITVVWDPEYQPQVRGNVSIDFKSSTLEEALDYLGVLTKSYWKALSPSTIFITMDNPNKRRDYEEQVAKVFFLSNVNTPQELQEIVNAVRSVADIQRFFPYNSQNAIIAKGSADQMALAEKLLHDLDKPKSEVVVDIIVMEASSTYTRQLTAALASTGLIVPGNFTPRLSLRSVPDAAPTTPATTPGTTPVTTTPTTSTSPGIPFSNLGRLSTADWSTTLPSALLQAVLSDARTKVLQSPQIRGVDGIKATMKIGDKVPTATGSFQPGIGGVGINPLVNTQFTFIDVGVNVELTPRVFDNGEVYLHIDLDISSVTGHVNLGGIDQPIIGQRKVSQEVRLREGSAQLLGGLTRHQETKQITGIPGLNSIPILRRLFSGETVDREHQELMIALIPHIVRRPEFTEDNLRGISVGTSQTVYLKYGRRPTDATAAPAPPTAPRSEESPAPATPGVATNLPPATAPPPGSVGAPPALAPPVTLPGLGPPATAPPPTAPAADRPPPPASTAPPPAPPATPSAAVVRFLPPTMDATAGASFTVNLVIENAADVMSAPLGIKFDPRIVQLTDVGRGDFFSGDGQIPVFTKNIQNEAGAALVNLNRQPQTPGVSGSGVVASFNFQGFSKGNTTITIPNLTVRDTQGKVVFSGSPSVVVNVR